jgi:hypothetical protein
MTRNRTSVVFRRPRGRLVVAVVLLALAGCATNPGGPADVDVTGRWLGTWEFESGSMGGGSVTADLKQLGSVVTGSLQVTGRPDRPITADGVVYGREYRLRGATLSGILPHGRSLGFAPLRMRST